MLVQAVPAEHALQVRYGAIRPGGPRIDRAMIMALFRGLLLLLLFSVLCAGCAKRATLKETARSITHDDVVVTSGDLSLSAVITRPIDGRGHPGVVILHGAGLDRPSDYQVFADSLAWRGIVVLAYESRFLAGPNRETVSPSFKELGEDASAALRVLRAQKDVDPQKVGLWALSRGGYTAPLTAVADSAVRFLVVISSPSLPVAFSDSSARVELAKDANLAANDIARAEQFVGLLFHAARHGGNDYERLQQEFSRVSAQPWFTALQIPAIPHEELWLDYGREMTYDPEPLWRRVEVPTLVIYGELDRPRLVEDSRGRILSALSATGAQVEAPVYAGADHFIKVAHVGGELRFAEDFFALQQQWILRHVQ